MRTLYALVSASMLVLGTSYPSLAQSIRLGPDGVEINPRERERPVEVERPLPREVERPRQLERRLPPRDEMRRRMFQFREACEDGDKRACVRLGIIIGENRERREGWRRENPELFFYER